MPALVPGSNNVARTESNASSTNQMPSTPPMSVQLSSSEVAPVATAAVSPKTMSSAHITRTFDLEPNAFPPLPGMGNTGTATGKKGEEKSSQSTQTASGVAVSSTNSQNQVVVASAPSTKTTVAHQQQQQQHSEVTPDLVAPVGAWGENRLADVVKGVTKKPLAPRAGSTSPPPLPTTNSIQLG